MQAILTAHLLFVALWLAWNARPPRTADALLALFLFGSAGVELIDVLLNFDIVREHPWLLGIYVPWLYALPPILYLYTGALTATGTSRGHGWRRGLVAGPLLASGCIVPYLLLDPAQQMAVLDIGYLHTGTTPWIARLPLQFAVLAYPLYSLAYLAACFVRLRRHMQLMEGFFSHIADKTLSWLRWVLLLLSIAVASTLVNTFSEPLLGYPLISDMGGSLIDAFWIYPLTFLALAKPPLFVTETERAEVREASLPSPRKYARSALTAADLKRIAGRLVQAMRDQRLYRDPALTLRGLSEHTGVPSNYLSQTLSVELGRSFFDFVNHWRVVDACEQLRDPGRSVIAICEEVGFQSRSTFNTAFKKQTGQTPSAYRKQLAIGHETPFTP